MTHDEMIEAVGLAIDGADVGYSISLTRLVDGVSTYTATCNGQTREFEEHYEASEWVSRFKLEAKARAAIRVIAPAVLEEAAKVAPAKIRAEGCETVGQWERRALREAIRALKTRYEW